ncbi:prenyl-dependent CAAX protease, putative [Cryptococcus deneoformans JEC21]|uniref:intramembrane prenyl-peptidase Rce1 n=1 Tax=Cryptococcus deneoformans (strain JEC21 / ATCC MYA-565) TaxID=214684 RepID=Q5K958_CRYD1|nr:prenyl-dependent CAAX protease, putative [Cryptococcus neoformans var. neoformans JEC21]AAW46237.2 prenyl-dependent CAAX protease, putative [Cryptococcus neoformans var. neoformans JEC21]
MDPSLSLPPALSSGLPLSTAHALSFLFTTSYVGSLYISQHFFGTSTPNPRKAPFPNTVRSQTEPLPPISATDADGLGVEHDLGPELGSRDHPITIKRRMRAVACSTLLSVGGVCYVVKQLGHYSWKEAISPTMALLGVPTGFVVPSRALPYLLTPGLMIGPLYAMYLSGEVPVIGWRKKGETLWSTLKREFGLVEVRNYIVGPLTEEMVFRSTILAVSLLGRLSLKSLVFGTPMWFGIAHAHHGFEMYKRNGRNGAAALQAILTTLFQLTYTTLFGWFASYLYLRTGSVLPPLSAHIYCNVMGIYLPTVAVKRYPKRKALILGTYLAGIVGFYFGIKVL